MNPFFGIFFWPSYILWYCIYLSRLRCFGCCNTTSLINNFNNKSLTFSIHIHRNCYYIWQTISRLLLSIHSYFIRKIDCPTVRPRPAVPAELCRKVQHFSAGAAPAILMGNVKCFGNNNSTVTWQMRLSLLLSIHSYLMC